MLSNGHGRKNDAADAASVGIAAMDGATTSATADEAITALRALVEHRDDVVKTRTQTVNRLHVLPQRLIPGGAPRDLDAAAAAQLLRPIRPRDKGFQILRRLAADLVAEVRHLDRRIAAVTTQIADALHATGCTLTELRGIGTLTAAKILARVGDIHRFRSAAAFASYTGTAPIEVSSGDVVRHRLSRAGDRQPNSCLHTMAITQIRHDGPGRPTTNANEPAARATWRPCGAPRGACPTPSTASYSKTPAVSKRRAREDIRGDYKIQRGWLNPYHQLFGQVTSRTRRQRPYNSLETQI